MVWYSINSYKSFTLLEVVVSLVIIGVIFGNISKFMMGNNNLNIYYELIKQENNFIVNDDIENSKYINFAKSIK